MDECWLEGQASQCRRDKSRRPARSGADRQRVSAIGGFHDVGDGRRIAALLDRRLRDRFRGQCRPSRGDEQQASPYLSDRRNGPAASCLRDEPGEPLAEQRLGDLADRVLGSASTTMTRGALSPRTSCEHDGSAASPCTPGLHTRPRLVVNSRSCVDQICAARAAGLPVDMVTGSAAESAT